MPAFVGLTGAQGLTSLRNATKGQGLLAGVAFLLCTMVIDRIVQGSFRRRE